MRWIFDTTGVGCDYRTAPVEPTSSRPPGSATEEGRFDGRTARHQGMLGIHGQGGGPLLDRGIRPRGHRGRFKVVHAEAASGGTLDTDIALNAGAGNTAVGHVVLDLSAGTGVVTFSAALGLSPASQPRPTFRPTRPVSGAGTESTASAQPIRRRRSAPPPDSRPFTGLCGQAVRLARCSASWSMARRSSPATSRRPYVRGSRTVPSRPHRGHGQWRHSWPAALRTLSGPRAATRHRSRGRAPARSAQCGASCLATWVRRAHGPPARRR